VEKRKLTLENAVELREKLDREIHENYQILVSCNSRDAKSKSTCNLEELLELTTSMEIQVIRLKEAIQKANLRRHSILDKNSNSFYIYKLSQLKIRRENLMKMSTKDGTYGKQHYIAALKKDKVNRMLKDLNEEIDKTSNKLSKFNTSKRNKIEIPFENNLLNYLN